MTDFIEDEDWQPPTEAELKVIQARRERSDKISKLMGVYLLKQYKMLGICCPICETILLQDLQGRNYCVACCELDADNVKDDPALSTEAARRQAAEQQQRTSTSSSKNSSPTEDVPASQHSDNASPQTQSTDHRLLRASLASDTVRDMPGFNGNHDQCISNHGYGNQGQSGHSNQSYITSQTHTAVDDSLESGARSGAGVDLVSPDLTRNTPKGPVFNQSGLGIAQGAIPVQESITSVRPRMSDSRRYPVHHHVSKTPLKASLSSTSTDCPEHDTIRTQTMEVLHYRLHNATVELQHCQNLLSCIELCQFIKHCAEAIEALHKTQASLNNQDIHTI